MYQCCHHTAVGRNFRPSLAWVRLLDAQQRPRTAVLAPLFSFHMELSTRMHPAFQSQRQGSALNDLRNHESCLSQLATNFTDS